MSQSEKYFKLRNNWRLDPDLIDLPVTTQAFFVGLVELCQTMGNGGEMTYSQVLNVARTYTRGRQAVDSLLSRGALSVDQPLSDGRTAVVAPLYDGCTPVRITNAARWHCVNNPQKAISPAKGESSRANAAPAPARVKTDRQTDKEPIRSPSGSDRIGSARAVPRSAGGAARPAPVADPPAAGKVDDDDPDDDLSRMSTAEKKAAITKAIREGQKRGPATGRDISFSRYDPNRKIEPLRSGFNLAGDQ